MRFGTNPTTLFYPLIHSCSLQSACQYAARLNAHEVQITLMGVSGFRRKTKMRSHQQRNQLGWLNFWEEEELLLYQKKQIPTKCPILPNRSPNRFPSHAPNPNHDPSSQLFFPYQQRRRAENELDPPLKKTTNTHPPGRSGENDSEYVGSWFSQVLSHNRLTPS